jgi:hypothetical protein
MPASPRPREAGAGRITILTSPSPVRPEYPPCEEEVDPEPVVAAGPVGTMGDGADAVNPGVGADGCLIGLVGVNSVPN